MQIKLTCIPLPKAAKPVWAKPLARLTDKRQASTYLQLQIQEPKSTANNIYRAKISILLTDVFVIQRKGHQDSHAINRSYRRSVCVTTSVEVGGSLTQTDLQKLRLTT